MSVTASRACDFCGKSIPGSHFESGRAVILIKKAYCHDCAQNALQKSKTARRTAGGGRISADGCRPDSAPPRKLTLGEHACCLYATDAERRAQVLGFARDGFRAGERVLYLIDDPQPGRVLDELEKDDLDVARLQKAGQLEVRPASELYAPEGRFEIGPSLIRLKAAVDGARKDGHPGLRLCSEMSWSLRGWPGSEVLADFEVRANQLFPELRCAALCQYEVPRYALPFLLTLKVSHPVVLGAFRS